MIVLVVKGTNPMDLFSAESGGHRWQRIPPTERNGRKHSSTITVAVFEQGKMQQPTFTEYDVAFRYCVSSVGAGGQNRQKNETCCIAKHVPSGIIVRCEDERSREANKRKAVSELRSRITKAEMDAAHRKENSSRSNQIGCGARGDKIRTVQLHNGVVTNHLSGKKMSSTRYMKGYVEEIQ